MLKGAADARAIYITDKNIEGVRQSLVTDVKMSLGHVWGGGEADYGTEVDVVTGSANGEIHFGRLHGVKKAGARASHSNESIKFTKGVKILTGYTTGAEVPLFSEGGTSNCRTEEHGYHQVKTNMDIALAQFVTDSPLGTFDDGALHYSTAYGRPRIRSLNSWKSIPTINSYAADPDTANLKREAGVTYWNTATKTLMVWDGAAYAPAVPRDLTLRGMSQVKVSNAAAVTWYPIATIAANNTRLIVDLFGGLYNNSTMRHDRFQFSDRSTTNATEPYVEFSTSGRGARTYPNLQAYQNADGSLSVYARVQVNSYSAFVINAWMVDPAFNATYPQPVTLGAGTTTAPSGTLIFDSATATPNAPFNAGDMTSNGNPVLTTASTATTAVKGPVRRGCGGGR